MEIVFISGWATSKKIWGKLSDIVYPVRFIEWTDLVHGNAFLPSSCILAGWSLGGQLALELSVLPQVKGLVLVSSMCCTASSADRPGVDPASHVEILEMLSRSRRGYLKSFFLRCGASREQLSLLLAESEAISDNDLRLGLEVMFSRVVRPAPSIPSAIIHGADDEIIPFDCSRYLFSELLCDAVHISVVHGSHLLPLTHPEVIIKAVNELAGRILS
jgi:pimeloyl-ACP methyl ester carboxylesterase